MKYTLTPTQKQYVIDNRFNMSMKLMAANLGIPFSRVRNYMQVDKLMLTHEQVQKLKYQNRTGAPRPEKRNDYLRPPHVPEPWNHFLNLVTMQTTV